MRIATAFVATLISFAANAQPYKLGDNPEFTAPVLDIENETARAPSKDQPQEGVTDKALLTAAENGDAKEIQRLLFKGVNPNGDANNLKERTALMSAVASGNSAAVQTLVNGGANLQQTGTVEYAPRTTLESVTPLALALIKGDQESAAYLTGRGAKPTPAVIVRTLDAMGQVTREEMPLLFLAKDPRALDMLLSANADPNVTNAAGKTALMEAAEKGDRGKMQVLLDAGANPNLRQVDGMTAYQLARRSGQGQAAAMLHALTPQSKRRIQVIDWKKTF